MFQSEDGHESIAESAAVTANFASGLKLAARAGWLDCWYGNCKPLERENQWQAQLQTSRKITTRSGAGQKSAAASRRTWRRLARRTTLAYCESSFREPPAARMKTCRSCRGRSSLK